MWRVDFRIWICLRIRSQNRNGLKGSVRDLGQSDLCKNIGKTGSLLCPFKLMSKNSISGESLLCFVSASLWHFPGLYTDTRKTWSHAQAQKLPRLIQILKEHKPHAGGRQRDRGHRVWTQPWSVVYSKYQKKARHIWCCYPRCPLRNHFTRKTLCEQTYLKESIVLTVSFFLSYK